MEQWDDKSKLTLRFTVGGRRYQVPVAEVERVLSLQRQAVSPIPFGLGRRVEGLFSFRGAALPLVRIAAASACQCGGDGDMTVVLLGEGAKRFGVIVDGVSSISDAQDTDAVSVCAETLYKGNAQAFSQEGSLNDAGSR